MLQENRTINFLNSRSSRLSSADPAFSDADLTGTSTSWKKLSHAANASSSMISDLVVADHCQIALSLSAATFVSTIAPPRLRCCLSLPDAKIQRFMNPETSSLLSSRALRLPSCVVLVTCPKGSRADRSPWVSDPDPIAAAPSYTSSSTGFMTLPARPEILTSEDNSSKSICALTGAYIKIRFGAAGSNTGALKVLTTNSADPGELTCLTPVDSGSSYE